MVIHAYLAAMLVAAAVGGPTEGVLEPDHDLLVAASDALADVEELGVILATRETPQVEELIDANGLQAQVVELLTEAGIKHIESEIGTRPKFVVHIEGVAVPECDKYVYRVQASLHRLMTLRERSNLRIRTEAWQVRPVMKVVPQPQAGEAVTKQVLTQTRAFVGKWKAARELLQRTGTDTQTPAGLEHGHPAQAGAQNLQAVSRSPFVASRSSSVFHRADCRWAQNITEANLVGYASREEAVQAGKRPCKSCNP